MAMSKKDLVTAISDQAGYTKRDVEAFLAAQEAVVHASLGEHRELTLPGIGRLSLAARAARIGRNPQTGEAVEIPARTVVKFAPTKPLKGSVA